MSRRRSNVARAESPDPAPSDLSDSSSSDSEKKRNQMVADPGLKSRLVRE